jgi:hypothetical protein
MVWGNTVGARAQDRKGNGPASHGCHSVCAGQHLSKWLLYRIRHRGALCLVELRLPAFSNEPLVLSVEIAL